VLSCFYADAGEKFTGEVLDLSGKLDSLPYLAEIVPRFMPNDNDCKTDSQPFLFLDFDGNGIDEILRSDSNGLVVETLTGSNRVLYSCNLPARFSQPGRPAFRVSLCADLTRDGQPEINPNRKSLHR